MATLATMIKNHRVLLLSALCSACSTAQTESRPSRPHVVVIVSDDAGYADFGVQGADDERAPRSDAIARNGVRFSDG